MTISRRSALKLGVAAGAALSIPSIVRAQTGSVDPQVVRMAMHDPLTAFDPIFAGTDVTVDHAMAIYDTLFALDSKLTPQPQMVGKWSVSEDKKTYTFELRDGLLWHDGSPVRAQDCVTSIRRWAQVDPGGQLIMGRAEGISKKDDKTFTIVLKEPLAILIDILASLNGYYPAIMREKDADRPATEQVTANIGSGPFKFNQELARPGASFTYDRNEAYLPRKEASDGYAGAKVANVDRVVWNQISDSQTALAALQAGEIDFIEYPPADLYSAIESDANLELQILNKSGQDYCLRMNHLQKPFDNVKARQAVLHLIDQEAFMRVIAPDQKYASTVKSIFGNSTLYSNDENTGWFKQGGNPEKAKQLFQEAGYAGEKVIILQDATTPSYRDASQLLATQLRNIGVNAELAPSDWGGIVARRVNKGPVESGGWSMFMTSDPDTAMGDPTSEVFMNASGDKAWYGWPKNDEYEALRAKWVQVETLDERKELARQMQKIWWDFGGDVRLCQEIRPTARRKALTGLIGMPINVVAMWNMRKV
ncbi:ABC transporter substrate-binding protein [Mesorhizobium sp. AR02]|uniref:ABC transporter substrate-binding protein n=1 Tax=Mesorhizobium sp. AR02 TaxID=2865837 RepID=UPI00215EA8D8|nr:ABC transporter substrate-binding protein [Mesorhizobium sp. AR02]UVK50464.1 ABC transporter substrate-binding protein [Mesorhizobium sp. AR02]